MIRPKHVFLLFAASFFGMWMIYASTVQVPYVNHDTVRYFHKFFNNNVDSLSYPAFNFLNAIGRPITARIESFLYQWVGSIADLSSLRFCTIFLYTVIAVLLARILFSQGLSILTSFSLSMAIFTLPGVQEMIFAPFIANSLSALVSLIAFVIWSFNKGIVYKVLGAAFLLIACFIYPTASLFFLIPTAVKILFFDKEWFKNKRLIYQDVCLWLVVAGIYFLLLNVFLSHSFVSQGKSLAFSLGDIFVRFKLFFILCLPQVFNLWNIYFSPILGAVLALTVVACFVINLILRTELYLVQRAFCLLIIFVLLNCVWFLYGGYLPRTFIVAQALAVLLLVWSVRSLVTIVLGRRLVVLPVICLFFMTIGAVWANNTVTKNVLNSNVQLNFVKSRLLQLVYSSTNEIHLIQRKDGSKGYNNLLTVYDNFNSSIPNYEVPDFFRVVMHDLSHPFQLHANIYAHDFGEPFQVSPNAIIIDMNDLVEILTNKRE